MAAIREPKTFYFNFDLPKDVDKNSKHEIEFDVNSIIPCYVKLAK